MLVCLDDHYLAVAEAAVDLHVRAVCQTGVDRHLRYCCAVGQIDDPHYILAQTVLLDRRYGHSEDVLGRLHGDVDRHRGSVRSPEITDGDLALVALGLRRGVEGDVVVQFGDDPVGLSAPTLHLDGHSLPNLQLGAVRW